MLRRLVLLSAVPLVAAGGLRPSRDVHAADVSARPATGAFPPAAITTGGASADMREASRTAASEDTIRQLRGLRRQALADGDLEAAAGAVQLSAYAARHERVASWLVLRHTLQRQLQGELADSAVFWLCRNECSALTEDPSLLLAGLERELAAPPASRPLLRAVLDLFAVVVEETLEADIAAAGLALPHPRRATELADSLARAGDHALAAELYHAVGYLRLPLLRHPGALADARSTQEAALRALELRRAAGDRGGEARTLSLLALSQIRGAATDSAAAHAAAAMDRSAGEPAALRALLARRAAVVAAATGDVQRAERLLADALVRLGDDAVVSRALHRAYVARELVFAGQEAGLAHARRAWSELVDAAAPRALRTTPALVLADAHRRFTGSDSAIDHFRHAAADQLATGDEVGASVTLAAAAEHAMERGRLDEAESLLGDAGAALANWPARGDAFLRDRSARVAAARLLNDLGTLHLLRGEWAPARARFDEAKQTGFAGPEGLEADRGLTLLDLAEGRPADLAAANRTAGLGWHNMPADGVAEPTRAEHRPLTDGLLHMHTASRLIGRGSLGAADRRLRQALPLLVEAGHEPALRNAHAARALFFAQLGRADSAQHYATLAGPALDPAASAVVHESAASTDHPAVAIRERLLAMPAAEALRLLEAQLAVAREDQDLLAEARSLELLGFWHLRRRAPADARTATLYYDSAAAALDALVHGGGRFLEPGSDWLRLQLAEQFTRLREEATLAWLARAGELGAEAAALGAAAAADRGRNRSFELLAGMQDGLLARAMDPFADASRPLPEIGAELLGPPAFSYGPPPAILAYMLAGDTLITWLNHFEAAAATGEGRRRLVVSRQAMSADSLVVLAAGLRASFGVDEASARALPDLDPNPLTRGFGFGSRAQALDAALAETAAALLPVDLGALPAGTDLVIVPFGPLAATPFAALPVDTAGTPLGIRFRTRFLPSLAAQNWVLRQDVQAHRPLPTVGSYDGADQRAARAAWLRRGVVVGDPVMPTIDGPDGERITLGQLAGASAEALAVAELLGVDPLTGNAATLAALRARAADATVLHLATHGFAYATEELVGQSFIALAPGAGHDGVLTADQLLQGDGFRLNATDLVVLSACQTGLGQVTMSEGTLGLQRAFLALGARTTLTSLWSVDDAATDVLMRAFYRHWLEGHGKAEALRRAQQELRGETGSRFHHPRYWAAFQLVGAP